MFRSTKSKLQYILPVLAIGVYFFFLAGGGLRASFVYDDLMNMCAALQMALPTLVLQNVLFFTPSYRPLGSLFYHSFFALFGFNPLPFRIFCFLFLSLNVWLAYAFASRLTGSREIGALTALLACFHTEYNALFYSTGMCYDVLCFSFYYGAFLYYLRVRQGGQPWNVRRAAIFLCLYVCALNAKEMAVTLPVLVGAWELMCHPPPSWRVIGTSAGITAAYIAGKVWGADSLIRLPAYKPSITFEAYMRQTRHYLDQLFYAGEWFDTARAVALLLALLLLALWWSERPHLRFCWLLVTVGVLPVAFIIPRDLSQLYIPMLGFAIYTATILVALRARVSRSPALAFGLAIPLLTLVHIRHGAFYTHWITAEQDVIRGALEHMRRDHPPLRKGARVLVAKDPFGDSPYASTYVLILYYRDSTLIVDRLGPNDRPPDPEALSRYDHVFHLAD